LSTPI